MTIPSQGGSLSGEHDRVQLPQGDIEMLAHVHYRGRQPTDVDDWAHIYETIRRTIR